MQSFAVVMPEHVAGGPRIYIFRPNSPLSIPSPPCRSIFINPVPALRRVPFPS
jgi:hypothetical protein